MLKQDALKGRNERPDSPVIQLGLSLRQQPLGFVQRLVQEDGFMKSGSLAGFAK